MIRITKTNIDVYKDDIIHLINYTLEDNEKSKDKVNDLISNYIFKNNTFIFGHVEDNKLVSFIWFFNRTFNNTERLHVSYLATNYEYRGKGLGKELMNKVVETAKEQKINFIDLNVDPNNIEAISLYNKLNFTTEKILLIKSLEEEF
ncbi:GNAT family N-acetyltransferase [Macrococcoides canis]|uniref:GNAT family N-acetyltransferase n=1 Tax=Macrococcoides canis TaxID=1855823 RepID=UPI0013E94149|nr:GNAT family N-acetyltransferase [Macrococcus canis]QIH75561.1 GNAT family N-acetyltransferase [Macrococcus canis]